jgi:hypothetical protein
VREEENQACFGVCFFVYKGFFLNTSPLLMAMQSCESVGVFSYINLHDQRENFRSRKKIFQHHPIYFVLMILKR